jgi:hypothetical protein
MNHVGTAACGKSYYAREAIRQYLEDRSKGCLSLTAVLLSLSLPPYCKIKDYS